MFPAGSLSKNVRSSLLCLSVALIFVVETGSASANDYFKRNSGNPAYPDNFWANRGKKSDTSFADAENASEDSNDFSRALRSSGGDPLGKFRPNSMINFYANRGQRGKRADLAHFPKPNSFNWLQAKHVQGKRTPKMMWSRPNSHNFLIAGGNQGKRSADFQAPLSVRSWYSHLAAEELEAAALAKALEEEYEAEEEMEAEAASEAGEIMEKRSEDDLASFYAGRGKRGEAEATFFAGRGKKDTVAQFFPGRGKKADDVAFYAGRG